MAGTLVCHCGAGAGFTGALCGADTGRAPAGVWRAFPPSSGSRGTAARSCWRRNRRADSVLETRASAGALGLLALVERGHDRVVNEIKHALFAHKLHNEVLAGWTFTSTMSRGSSTSSTQPGELALHHAVGVGFLERGGEQLGLDQTPVDEKMSACRACRARKGEKS